MIEAKCGTAWTQVGRKVKLDQAIKGLEILESKATRAFGDPIAQDQARWCAALVARLHASRA